MGEKPALKQLRKDWTGSSACWEEKTTASPNKHYGKHCKAIEKKFRHLPSVASPGLLQSGTVWHHSLCKVPWFGTPCQMTSAHSRTMSPLDSAWKPGFSLATSVLSALETLWQLCCINSHLPLPLPPTCMINTLYW